MKSYSNQQNKANYMIEPDPTIASEPEIWPQQFAPCEFQFDPDHEITCENHEPTRD